MTMPRKHQDDDYCESTWEARHADREDARDATLGAAGVQHQDAQQEAADRLYNLSRKAQ